jgi:predicted  nucleic acid-binding Zn-ribbon protein
MSDWAALTAAGIISDTLWIQEFGRALRERRDFQNLAIDNALVRREAAEVVVHYNKLVADFNDLRRQAIEAAQEADRRGAAIADLQHEAEALRREKDSLETECARLRQENKEKGVEITFLRHILRQEHPDRYPPE